MFKVDSVIQNKIILLTVLLFFSSACVNGTVGSFRNRNKSLFTSSNPISSTNYRLICCKKRCVLAAVNKSEKRHVF